MDGSELKVMQVSERAVPHCEHWTSIRESYQQRPRQRPTLPALGPTSTITRCHYHLVSSCHNYLLSTAICNFYSLPLLWPPEPHPLSIQGWPGMAFCIPDFLILLQTTFLIPDWNFGYEVKNFIPDFREGGFEADTPADVWEREFSSSLVKSCSIFPFHD